MSDDTYQNIVAKALDIQITYSYSKYKATSRRLPPGSPVGYHDYNKNLAVIDLLSKIFCSTYRQQAIQLIDEKMGKKSEKVNLNWSYHFTKDNKCEVIITDDEGRTDSRVMKMIPEEE